MLNAIQDNFFDLQQSFTLAFCNLQQFLLEYFTALQF